MSETIPSALVSRESYAPADATAPRPRARRHPPRAAARSLAVIGIMILLPAAQVVLREILGFPFVGAEEMTRFMLICLVFVTFPYVVASGANIRLVEGVHLLPKPVQRGLQVVVAATSTAVLAVAAASVAIATARNLQNATPTLGIPYYVFFSAAFWASSSRRPSARSSSGRRSRAARPTSSSLTRPHQTTWMPSSRRSRRKRSAERRSSSRDACPPRRSRFFFLLGWPVVLAVMIPAVVYVLWNGFPIELIGQRIAYALDSLRWSRCRSSFSLAT